MSKDTGKKWKATLYSVQGARLTPELDVHKIDRTDDKLTASGNEQTQPEISYKPKFISLWKAADTVKKPDWLIKGHVEMDTLSGLFAQPGNCKSMLAIDIAACIATGKDWHGRRVKQGAVLYIAGEGRAGLKKRTKAWKIKNQNFQPDAPLYLCEGSINGQNRIEIMTLCTEFENMHNVNEVPVNLVVIDTLARNFGTGDENNQSDMGTFIANMDFIRNRWKCAVLIVHHTGHNDKERARGSSAFKAALDAEYTIRKDEKMVELKSTKMKDADEPDPICFELYTIDLEIVDEDNQAVTSAVLDLTDKDMPKKKERHSVSKLTTNYSVALGILESMYMGNRNRLTKGKQNPEKAVIEIIHWRQRCIEAKITKSHNWNRIPKKLEEKGFIVIREKHVFLTNLEDSE